MSLGQNNNEDATPRIQGAVPLIRIAGITVFVHWSWLVVAVIEVQHRSGQYKSIVFNVIEYLALFGLVLLHEFGHALACRSVGGKADRILLWPLGGVAFVDPPQRPGAILWSIVAGPLVNVVLVPALIVLGIVLHASGVWETNRDVYDLWRMVSLINVGLLIFNLMPVYPLDGGQIVRSLLWFLFGRANSLIITTIIGFLGVGLLILLAILAKSVWFGIMAVFILMSCWRGLLSALELARFERVPRRREFACPACKAQPMVGAFWKCSRCETAFDTFQNNATCPKCGTMFLTTLCSECGESHPLAAWKKTPPPVSGGRR